MVSSPDLGNVTFVSPPAQRASPPARHPAAPLAMLRPPPTKPATWRGKVAAMSRTAHRTAARPTPISAIDDIDGPGRAALRLVRCLCGLAYEVEFRGGEDDMPAQPF